ncbi:MAG TPA: sodium:solute symporter family protein [Gemmatimonadales bacterium]|nr:sodium:solute symporter family protein [Gemmatimonadales bacterium]
MSGLDWGVVVLYLAGSMAVGLALAKRGSGSMVEFFVGGRSVPWWLAATSMAATTFNVDTPLYVAGLVARSGVAGNWEWWCFGLAHVLLAVLLARLWRRAAVLTDAELTELRYSGRPAALLRGTRAFLFAVPLNCLGIGYGMLAMRKVIVALGLLDGLTWLPGDPQLWAVVVVVAITLAYTTVSGLWGVIATDFIQYVLAMVGAFVVAAYAVHEVGGLHALTTTLRASGQGARLDLVPTGPDAMLPLGTFLGYLGIQWWAFKNADGGGMFVQRLSATANEREATKAAHAFNILNYVVRTWPWVVVGLAALVILPGMADPELAYPTLMLRYLPSGVLGLVFASLLAAFMSTVSTQVNWGASYVVHDLYGRFAGVTDERKLLRAARWTSIGITVLAAALSFAMDSVGQMFRLLVLVGTGTGALLLLRWFWWRINAWAEITAMVAGMVLAAVASSVPALKGLPFGTKLAFTTFGAMACWLPVLFLTRPEAAATLDAFYARTRPPGAWGPVRARTGLTPADSLARAAWQWLLWVTVILGGTLGVGWVLLR